MVPKRLQTTVLQREESDGVYRGWVDRSSDRVFGTKESMPAKILADKLEWGEQ